MAIKHILKIIPLAWRVKLEMWHSLGYWPNIDNPRTFNEKVAHRKLRERDDRFRILADKWEVRNYVRSKIGDNNLSKVYAVISSISELDFRDLPERFVAKPTNQSGKVYFVKSKSSLNKDEFFSTIKKWLRSKFDYGIFHGEYWYKDIPSRVMFEEYLSDGKHDIPPDFKIYVFHGRAHVIQVSFRFPQHRMNFYTREWQQIPLRKGDRPNEPINPGHIKPDKLEEMIAIAETLGSDFDFIRVDLYYLSNSRRIVFGELTPAPGSGYSRFTPRHYDFEFGKLW